MAARSSSAAGVSASGQGGGLSLGSSTHFVFAVSPRTPQAALAFHRLGRPSSKEAKAGLSKPLSQFGGSSLLSR